MKKINIGLAVGLVIINMSVYGCAAENAAENNKQDAAAIQEEENHMEVDPEDIVEQAVEEGPETPPSKEIENQEKEQREDNEAEIIESDEELEGEKYKSNGTIKVSVERTDKSIVNDEGQTMAIIYYDKPVVTGNTKAAYEINEFFNREEEDWLGKGGGRLTWFKEGDYERFCRVAQSMREQYGDDIVSQQPAIYTVDTRIKYLDENVLSIFQITTFIWESGCRHYYGSTFDLETGELLAITDLIEIDAHDMKRIMVDAIHENESYDEMANNNFEYMYYDIKVDMKYEYFYDGEKFYIIENYYYNEGTLIEWNGKWDENYAVESFWCEVDRKSEKIIRWNGDTRLY